MNLDLSQLVLSTFSGIGLLDSGFTKLGFCVVNAPELILGGNIKNFVPIPNRFNGVVGGSPCQEFSVANRSPNKDIQKGIELMIEFGRVVVQSNCDWWLLENVPAVPDLVIKGYHVQRFNLCPTDIIPNGTVQSRRRRFQFGSKAGFLLNIQKKKFMGIKKPCVKASEGKRTEKRTFAEFCQLQGLPPNFDLPSFNKASKYQAVGNGVHSAVSEYIAKAILEVLTANNPKTIHNTNTCACGCGLEVSGRKKSATDACRKRLELFRKNPKRVIIPGLNIAALSQ